MAGRPFSPEYIYRVATRSEEQKVFVPDSSLQKYLNNSNGSVGKFPENSPTSLECTLLALMYIIERKKMYDPDHPTIILIDDPDLRSALDRKGFRTSEFEDLVAGHLRPLLGMPNHCQDGTSFQFTKQAWQKALSLSLSHYPHLCRRQPNKVLKRKSLPVEFKTILVRKGSRFSARLQAKKLVPPSQNKCKLVLAGSPKKEKMKTLTEENGEPRNSLLVLRPSCLEFYTLDPL